MTLCTEDLRLFVNKLLTLECPYLFSLAIDR
jgi:hypothetical protein